MRPANDTGVDLDFGGDPALDRDFVRSASVELDCVAESLAAVEPETEEMSLSGPITADGPPEDTEPTEELADATDELDDTEAGADGGADEDPPATTGVTVKSDEPQSFLAMYFRDMAELSVLKPEQEFETARHIEQLELGLWQDLLGYAPWAAHLVITVETAMHSTLPDLRNYRALSERAARKSTTADKRRLAKVIVSLAAQIKELDIDRVFVDAALTELQRLGAAARMKRPIEGLPFGTTTKSFQDFAASITKKSGIVKHAKNEFVKANLRLVVSIARRFNHGRLPLPDLIQEGNIGLMKAVERYDYRRGFRFSTYASWWIRHAISRALADKGRAVRLPVHMIDAYHRIAKSERELQSKLERPATTEEIASVTGIEAEKLEKMRTFLADNPVSLDRSISEDDGRRLIDILVDPNEAPSPPEQMMSTETQQEMLKLLSVLKPIEADILRKRFGLVNEHERTLKEIGDEYRLSRERVRQLQEQALGKMRKAMAKREIL
ncbi:MAG: sigma-70 family RNA polymerase sigma factor [Deltaproteobacteria bacterium]|nr:sigma-70 family RNA polymerase sigma factor [Deltaproteobacteria bacterium]